jgi:radical SAM protein with 4Fe4S-binding SPASM domain
MPLTLSVDGDLRLCNHSPIVAGNIHRDPLSTILASPYLAAWRRPPALCASCARWTSCRGGCRAASEQSGLGLEYADPAIPASIPIMTP